MADDINPGLLSEQLDLTFDLPDGTVWTPWHTWTENRTTWIDARIVNAKYNHSATLDIGGTADSCCVTGATGLAAWVVWEEGGVLRIDAEGIPALIVPEPTLTAALIREALNRAWVTGILPLPMHGVYGGSA